MAHAPYTLNACSSNESTRQFAYETMLDDLNRMEYTPNQLYNFHPGSHVGKGSEKGIENCARLLSQVITPGQGTRVLIETMAGKGSEIGKSFEEIRTIIDSVSKECRPHVGVCLDTCHISDGGYDIANEAKLIPDLLIGDFDSIKSVPENIDKITLPIEKDITDSVILGLIRIYNAISLEELNELLPYYYININDLKNYIIIYIENNKTV